MNAKKGNTPSDQSGKKKPVPPTHGGGTADKGNLQQTESSVPQGGARSEHLAADQKMDDDTGFSNTVNRQSVETDQENPQAEQSNVGRRSDGTPD